MLILGVIMHPEFLKEGSVVGITCPSGYVSADRVRYAVTVLERWGYRVVVGDTVGKEHHYFSGTDAERLADLQRMLDAPHIGAILMGRGGYGMSRIIDDIDWRGYLKHPKWLCGFSDITVLHSHVQAQYYLPTLHSPMCGAFAPDTEHEDWLVSLQRALRGEELVYGMDKCVYNRPGKAVGVLTGGNLAMLAHVTGSVSEVDMMGKILFVEDIGEHLYNVDRMLLNLKRAGKLANLAGLVVGSFTELQDTTRPFGQTIAEIITDKVREYDYPVCFGMQAGHQTVNYTLMLGALHMLEVTDKGGVLSMVR